MKNIPEDNVVVEEEKQATRSGGGGEEDNNNNHNDKGKSLQLTEEQRAFVRTLNGELQKFNRFFINSEEDFVMKESRLDDEYRTVVDEVTGCKAPGLTPENHRRILTAFADFHGELVLMEHWVSLNYTALVKILKKHDKRSNVSLRSPFLVSVLQQPFYSTEVLSQLIIKVEGRFRQLSTLLTKNDNGGGCDNDNGSNGGANAGAAGGEGGRESGGALTSTSGEAAGANGIPSTTGGDAAGALITSLDSNLARARAKAAMEFFDGMKTSESILRPYGDNPGGRRIAPAPGGAGGVGGKRNAEEEGPVGDAANSPAKKVKPDA